MKISHSVISPKVTVALMVYNEQAHVIQAMESILRQGFRDFELLIGDNCSTDGTTEIIEEFARKDTRIRHLLHRTNVGALQNWNALVRAARGEYFVLASGHDLWSDDYLEKLSLELDINQDAALSFAKTEWLDIAGRTFIRPTSLISTDGMNDCKRFAALMIANQHYLYGMFRLSALRKTRLQREILGSGEILLQELAAFGCFVYVEGPRWYRRLNRRPETRMMQLARYHQMLFSSARTRRRFCFFPSMQMLFVYLTLPFTLSGADIYNRFGMITLYPFIIFRFAPMLFDDIRWLLNCLKSFIGK